MGKIIFVLCLFVAAIVYSPLKAQTDKPRVAVFDPASSGNNIDEGIAIAAREIVSSVLVNTDKYNIVERSLLDKILKEQKFSNSGAVDESQISELGKLVGANKAVLIVLTSAGKFTLLSIKMVDVESANVESQKVKTIMPDDLLSVIEPLSLELIGEAIERPIPETTQKKSFLSNILNRNNDEPSIKDSEKENNKEKFIQRNEMNTVLNAPTPKEKKEILFEFKGIKGKNNPTAKLYLNEDEIGNGTLNEGFYVKFNDQNSGVHKLRIEWSGTVHTTSFDINTNKKNHYEFEYKKTGFGYTFKMK